MSVILNSQCPECAKNGADRHGKYLMTFADGGKLCIHTHNHDSRKNYYVKPDGSDPLTSTPIDGTLKYTADQFRKLETDGVIKDDFTRQLALSGMRMADRYEVLTQEERDALEVEWAADVEWFKELKVKNLVDRGIHGYIAKMYDVRVGHDEKGTINRHYYPVHDLETLDVIGAKARTLPKDFMMGHLGRRFGQVAMFGVHTMQTVLDSGTFKKGKMGKLMVVGGEPDAMAAQQIMIKALNKIDQIGNVTWDQFVKLKKVHVWSPTKGETCIEEIVNNREFLDQFEEIVWAFDDDDVGNKLNLAASRLFKQKSKFFTYPSGCKDANQCLKLGRDKEFVDSWWSPAEARVRGKLKTVGEYRKRASKMLEMGIDYFEPALNAITFGLQLRHLSVWGAGTGVGKTEITTQHVKSVMRQGHSVVAIYLENSPDEVVKMFAGDLVNKDFTSPPLFAGETYNPMRDYTQADLDDALTQLEESGLLYIPDLEGSKDVSVIMEVLRDSIAMGHQFFVVDNLTAFEHRVDDKVMTGVTAIDETMKQIGTFKDENDVNIMLLCHLTRDKNRTAHELGGEVYITDFRGAGSISFWANSAWAIERNTQADTIEDKCTTLIRNLKSRGVGYMVGTTVVLRKDLMTGKFIHLPNQYKLPQVGRSEDEGEEKPRRRTSNPSTQRLIDDATNQEQEF